MCLGGLRRRLGRFDVRGLRGRLGFGIRAATPTCPIVRLSFWCHGVSVCLTKVFFPCVSSDGGDASLRGCDFSSTGRYGTVL